MSDAVTVALITGVVAIIAAIPAILGARNGKAIKDLHSTVGEKNGAGDITTMLEHVISGQGKLAEKIEEHSQLDDNRFAARETAEEAIQRFLAEDVGRNLVFLVEYSRERNHNLRNMFTRWFLFLEVVWSRVAPDEPSPGPTAAELEALFPPLPDHFPQPVLDPEASR